MDTSTNHTIIPKPPVVAVLGHVDHGKTTLLDYIRKSRITAGEHGSITQHIGAYEVPVNDTTITFIDTPGHEAFMNLRTRGARVADIALLVIDAGESIKPQTIESIKIIHEANVPFIVALNKIDLPTAQPKKVMRQLLQHDVMVEEHGGKIACLPISAKTGEGVQDLLETILLVTQMKKIMTSKTAPLRGVIIEAQKDKNRGVVATVIVHEGTLRTGDKIITGGEMVKVRGMFDDRGVRVDKAEPSKPVAVIGWKTLPSVGEVVSQAGREPSEKIAVLAEQKPREQNEEALLRIFLKADTHGSLEAIMAQLPPEVTVDSTGIGDITETEIAYAKTTGQVIIGFNVRFAPAVLKLARDEKVRVRVYTIIYKLLEEIDDVIETMKSGPRKTVIGQAKILQEFTYNRARVAGCQVTEGRMARGDNIVVVRRGEEIGEPTKIASLRQQKEEVTKVEKGKLCGIRMARAIDFQIGDVIQSYTLYEF